jgi:hypothetical protein
MVTQESGYSTTERGQTVPCLPVPIFSSWIPGSASLEEPDSIMYGSGTGSPGRSLVFNLPITPFHSQDQISRV